MTTNEIETLQKIRATLNQLSVVGKQNMLIVITCMNEMEKLIKEADDGDTDT